MKLKKIYYFLALFLLYTHLSTGQNADAGPDRVDCDGLGVIIGAMDENENLCFTWKSSPSDPEVDGLSEAKIYVNPAVTTVYTLTVIGQDFSFISSDEVKVTVVDPNTDVSFEEHPNQNFGFDKLPNNKDIYISVDDVGSTKVRVRMKPFTADAYWVTSSDPTKFNVPGDSVKLTSDLTDIDIIGQGYGSDRESALLEVRCGGGSGEILKTLNVQIYRKLNFGNNYFYSVKDPSVPATNLRYPKTSITPEYLTRECNVLYRQAVVEVSRIDVTLDRDINYDLNKNGRLDYYNGNGESNPEIAKIINAQLPGKQRIVYVEKMQDNWRFSNSTNVGDTKIKLVTVAGLAVGKTYTIGANSAIDEKVTIKSIDASNNTITVDPLANNHDISHTLYGGLAGLAGNPALVTNAGNELIVTTAHEILHNPETGDLADVIESDNVMYFTTGGVLSDRKLRYRGQSVVGTGTGVPNGTKQNQWDKITRTVR